MPGRHNVQNALAAIGVAAELGIPDEVIARGFERFGGVKRRFTRVGEIDGATVIDDYGHHPVEIKAVLAAAREGATGRVIAVVQPHRFTRLRDLMDDFQAPSTMPTSSMSRRSTRRRGADRGRGRGRVGRRPEAAWPPDGERTSAVRGPLPAAARHRPSARRHGDLPRRGRHHQMGRGLAEGTPASERLNK
jgi:hypothetical protein